jgi:hypothetical protein
MKMYRWLTLIVAVLITVFEVLIFAGASSTANAASPAPCAMRLRVELTPDVPNPDDVGFLSSLLSNQAGYRLTLQPQDDQSVIVLDLTGPGPDYRCQNVIETMRRDARVLSVHVDSDETQAVSVVTAPVPPEGNSNTYLSHAGIGSLYWAARNPAQAWRVVFPVQPDDATDAYADVRARCAFITNAPSGRAACP